MEIVELFSIETPSDDVNEHNDKYVTDGGSKTHDFAEMFESIVDLPPDLPSDSPYQQSSTPPTSDINQQPSGIDHMNKNIYNGNNTPLSINPMQMINAPDVNSMNQHLNPVESHNNFYSSYAIDDSHIPQTNNNNLQNINTFTSIENTMMNDIRYASSYNSKASFRSLQFMPQMSLSQISQEIIPYSDEANTKKKRGNQSHKKQRLDGVFINQSTPTHPQSTPATPAQQPPPSTPAQQPPPPSTPVQQPPPSTPVQQSTQSQKRRGRPRGSSSKQEKKKKQTSESYDASPEQLQTSLDTHSDLNLQSIGPNKNVAPLDKVCIDNESGRKKTGGMAVEYLYPTHRTTENISQPVYVICAQHPELAMCKFHAGPGSAMSINQTQISANNSIHHHTYPDENNLNIENQTDITKKLPTIHLEALHKNPNATINTPKNPNIIDTFSNTINWPPKGYRGHSIYATDPQYQQQQKTPDVSIRVTDSLDIHRSLLANKSFANGIISKWVDSSIKIQAKSFKNVSINLSELFC